MEKYSSGLVAESFWFVEFKQLIKLRNEGKSWEEISLLCLNENLLGISKPYRANRIFGYLKNRINVLDERLIQTFLGADLKTQKIINIFAISRKNKLFFEFLYEVYREKVVIGVEELTASDINIFFKNKQAQDETINKWTDVTLKRLRSSYMNFLTDAGLLTNSDKRKLITPAILDITLENYLIDINETQLIKAITGDS
ncbi:DUF1819 family protein [Peribacillus sp. FSL K6-1552]|uniref:DUF1819 family protein n=1 Tax=Peribacillus sp. FSL K6-1552 TaxID=2954514 RepID=UPI0030FC7D55